MTLRLLSALFSKFSNGKVLEIGAGRGYWAFSLARYNNQVTIVEDGRESLDPGFCELAPVNNPVKIHYPVSASQFMESNPLWSDSGALFLCWPRPSDEMAAVVQKYQGNLIVVIGLHEEGRGSTLELDKILSTDYWKKRQGKAIPLAQWPHVDDSVQVWIRI